MIYRFYTWWGDVVEHFPYRKVWWVNLLDDILTCVAWLLAIRVFVANIEEYTVGHYVGGHEDGAMSWHGTYIKSGRWRMCKKHYGDVAHVGEAGFCGFALRDRKATGYFIIGVCDGCWNHLRYAGGP